MNKKTGGELVSSVSVDFWECDNGLYFFFLNLEGGTSNNGMIYRKT